MTYLVDVLITLIYVLMWCIILRAVLSWFSIRPDNTLVTILHRITDPILVPLGRIVPRIGMMDITPMVAIILLWVVIQLIYFLY